MIRALMVAVVAGVLASCGGRSESGGGTRVVRDGGAVAKSVEFAARPVDVAVAPSGGTVYVKGDRSLVVLDVEKWTVRQELPYGGTEGGATPGLAVSGDGHWIYATTTTGLLREATVEAEGKLAWGRSVPLRGSPSGVALSDDARTGWVCLSMSNSLAVVDLAEMKPVAEIPVGDAPYGVAVSPDRKTAYVTNRGGGSTGTVSVVDLGERREVARIEVGPRPAGLALTIDGARLYVANADAVSVIDTAGRKVSETIRVRPNASRSDGRADGAVAFGADERTLLVAGGVDGVAVVRIGEAGGIRVTAFDPLASDAVGVASDGRHAFVAGVKAGRGTAAKVELPSAGKLAQSTRGGGR